MMLGSRGAAVLALLALSACAEVESLKTRFFPFQTEEEAATESPGARHVGPGAGTAVLPPMPRRKPAHQLPAHPDEADPQLLVGLDFASTKALLGDPALQLEQPPAKVWAYNGGICMFNVFFYPSVDDNTFRILTYEVTDGTPPAAGAEPKQPAEGRLPEAVVLVQKGDNRVARRCLAELLASRDNSDAG